MAQQSIEKHLDKTHDVAESRAIQLRFTGSKTKVRNRQAVGVIGESSTSRVGVNLVVPGMGPMPAGSSHCS